MKKLICLLAIIAIGFTSCHSANPIIGTWQLESILGEELTDSEKEATFTMNKDGSFERKRGGKVKNGKWKLSDNSKTLTITQEDGDVEIFSNFNINKGKMTFSERDDAITLKKVK